MGAEERLSVKVAQGLLVDALGLAEGQEPFPWQRELLRLLCEGAPPEALDIPTGLGKTSVIALWLLARAAGAKLPRRLVYVVDRRAVVDQATDEAARLQAFVEVHESLKEALGIPGNRKLPVSTLRGQLADNRAWLEDPAAPAIIVGTVDMVGSRLLFGGYGVSRKMRPYHAGLLGADSLFVLDEAHLVPPFERLLEAVKDGDARGLGPSEAQRAHIPKVQLLSLSATGKTGEGAFRLTDEDRRNPVVKQRIHAKKALDLKPEVDAKDLVARVSEVAWGLATGSEPRRLLIYVNSRKDAEAIEKDLRNRLIRERKGEEPRVALFVGARRVFEREEAASRLRELGFLGSQGRPTESAIVVATSAAEVGVDLDADAAVMDLVPWQRMVQRLGRINRRGEQPVAPVVIIPVKAELKEKKNKSRAELEEERRALRLEACAELLHALPALDDGFNGSPDALDRVRREAEGLVQQASDPAPLHPPLLRPHVDAWAMTSIPDHPGRPQIWPWLRGWDAEVVPQATVVFRDLLPVQWRRGSCEPLAKREMEVFMDAAGPHALERLETEAFRIVSWLQRRFDAVAKVKPKEGAKSPLESPLAVFVKNGSEGTKILPKALERKDQLVRQLAGAVVFVSPLLGGLQDGLLDEQRDAGEGPTPDLTNRTDADLPLRIQALGAEDAAGAVQEDGWARERMLPIDFDADGDPAEYLVIDRRVNSDPLSEAGRSVARRAQDLEEHQSWVEAEAVRLADRLGLDARLRQALRLAALLHDEGKRADRWQRAFRVPKDERPLAKSLKAPLLSVLGKYRHELGSLEYVVKHAEFQALDEESQDLVLHLVAAHHGRARPVLPIEDADGPPTLLRQRAQDAALRFDRLSRAYGPWGLAWLESLLRAADQRASALNDKKGRDDG